MRANAIIYEWADSWGMVEDVPVGQQRIEAYLNAGSAQSEEEAERLAEAELARFRDGQSQVTVGVDGVDPGDLFPNLGKTFDVDGDTARMVALTFGRDTQRDRRLVFVPQFGDVIESPERLQQRAAKKMANGTLGGAARSARPAAPPLVVSEDVTVRIPVQRVTQAEYDALDPVIEGVLYAIVG